MFNVQRICFGDWYKTEHIKYTATKKTKRFRIKKVQATSAPFTFAEMCHSTVLDGKQ